jgi:hypothetical protein
MTDDKRAVLHFQMPTGGNSVARVVRGHKMGAIKDGWLVIYDEVNPSPPIAPTDDPYVMRTVDGRTLLRYLRKGRKRGVYDLLAVTGEPLLDVALEWASPVTWIKPYQPPVDDDADGDGSSLHVLPID